MDDTDAKNRYLAGISFAAFVPSITLTADQNFIFEEAIPKEYQPRLVDGRNDENVLSVVSTEFDIFEQDFVDLENQQEVQRYEDLLLTSAPYEGDYSSSTRNYFVSELVMGDQYSASGQIGAMGRRANATGNVFNQTWQDASTRINLQQLIPQLSLLRAEMQTQANTPEEAIALGDVAAAEVAAKNNDGPTVMQRLQSAGKWALDIASKIGVPIAVEALKAALNL